MIPDVIRAEILRRIRAAEAEHQVRVLLAVESGSRAWGFESPDSDFDARFIYAHPAEWYLSIGLEEERDVIEYPIADNIDLSGWDVRKALRLFWKSNPAFVLRTRASDARCRLLMRERYPSLQEHGQDQFSAVSRS